MRFKVYRIIAGIPEHVRTLTDVLKVPTIQKVQNGWYWVLEVGDEFPDPETKEYPPDILIYPVKEYAIVQEVL